MESAVDGFLKKWIVTFTDGVKASDDTTCFLFVIVKNHTVFCEFGMVDV